MRITVKASPYAKKAKGIRESENIYRVRVDAPAKDGAANRRLVKILAGHFHVPKSAIRIVAGFTERSKVAEIF